MKPKKTEFFIADKINVITFRNEIASMEHPFFALKTGDVNTKKYRNGKITIVVSGNSKIGLATVFDKDVWIYIISKIQTQFNKNKFIKRTIFFTPYNFFQTTQRSTSGRAYKDLKKVLTRLASTRIETNISYYKDKKIIRNFGLIDSWTVVEEKKEDLDIGMIEVTIPNWLYLAIKKTKVLKIHPHYFKIRKAIDRRVYEIARKHCGNQNEFLISVEKLFLKSGSMSEKKEFNRAIKKLSVKNNLPDYSIDYNPKSEKVLFINRNTYNTKIKLEKQKQKNQNEIEKIRNKIINSKKR